jgi:ribose 5-phosphate isomerase B
VRAADCTTPYLAEMARRHNDCNVLCLGGRLLSDDEAWAIVEVWLATGFEGGRHEHRVELLDEGGTA